MVQLNIHSQDLLRQYMFVPAPPKEETGRFRRPLQRVKVQCRLRTVSPERAIPGTFDIRIENLPTPIYKTAKQMPSYGNPHGQPTGLPKILGTTNASKYNGDQPKDVHQDVPTGLSTNYGKYYFQESSEATAKENIQSRLCKAKATEDPNLGKRMAKERNAIANATFLPPVKRSKKSKRH